MKSANRFRTHRPLLALTSRALLAATLFLLLAGATSAHAAGPEWRFSLQPSADFFLPNTPEVTDENAVYTIEAENVGNQPTSASEPIVIEDTLPPGLEPAAVKFYSTASGYFTGSEQSLSNFGFCLTLVRCEYPGPLSTTVSPGERLLMLVRVDVTEGTSGPVTNHVEISGGGTPAAEASATNEVGTAFPYRFDAFSSTLTGFSGQPYTQAGGHPYQFSTQVDIDTVSEAESGNPNWGRQGSPPVRDPQSISSELPPGLLANPQGVPHCALADYFANDCSISTIVGFVGYRGSGFYQGGFEQMVPLFNLQPTGAYPGELGYDIQGLPFLITTKLRSGSDYGVTADAAGLLPVALNRVRVTLWGVPAEHSHDALRGKLCRGGPKSFQWSGAFSNNPDQNERECEQDTGGIGQFPNGGPAEAPPTPFVTMPTECSGNPLLVVAHSASWQVPGEEAQATTTIPAVGGCNALKFEPTIEAHPTTDLADSPSGFDFKLKVPQNEDPEGLVSADLREAVVKLPPGLVVNPSSAAGLQGCSPADIGLTTPVGATPAHFSEVPDNCPDASKLGTVEVKTQLLHNPLQGSVYLATPHQNPSGGLLAGYIVLEGEGIIVKLAGQFQTDKETGQITASFLENPQTPFEEFKFHFFEGARGALRTPPVCGNYEVTSTLTPYSSPESGPPAEPTSEFETSFGPAGEGSPCPSGSAAEEPNHPVLHAGTESQEAGAYSPFSLKLVRHDGEQEIDGIETVLPPGLVGRLAGTSYCSDAAIAQAAANSGRAEQAKPSCPAASEVGVVDVSSGAGPTPLNVGGHAYLAGPYKGAPLSLVIVTPAVAGPFDLGDVVVRAALYVDPFTAQITARSDRIPTILEGIPLDVRSITLKMSRPHFTLNPTNCEPLAIGGSTQSVFGQTTPFTQRFQVGGCKALKFKPKLSIKLKGGTRRSQFPALTATLKMPPGGANVAAAQVTLPHSSFLANAHIAKTCGRPELAAHTCPAASIYGHARAVTPLLDHPLEGPVYLATGFGYKLPALVADLNGQIEVLLKGKVDTGREDGIRNTFEVVPDAPVSSFTLQMFGGKRSLIENSESLCGPHAKTKALARFTAQSGKTVELEPTVKNSCRKKHGRHGKVHGHKKGKGG